MNQEETEDINRPVTSNETKTVILKLPTNKSPRPNGFTGKVYKHLGRVNIHPSETLSKNCRERNTPELIL